MDWDDVQHFLALAEAGSARAAGTALGVSHSTVVRRVEALELRLSARLFDRGRDGYTLTDAGRQMLPGARRIADEMAALERTVIGKDTRLVGTVAITCCDNYVAGLLLEELTGFCQTHPGIELVFTSDGRLFDLARREADVAIRAVATGTTPREHLIGRTLAPLKVASYVAREHAERLDPELGGAQSRWLGFDERVTMELMVAGSGYPQLPIWGSFATLELMHRAVRRGLGVAMLPTWVGDPDGALCRLTRPDLRHMGDLWLVSHPDLRDNARFRATRAAIVDAFDKHAALFTGERWCTHAPERHEIAPDDRAGSPVG